MGASTPSMPRYTPSELPQPPGATELPAWPWDRVQFDGSESLARQSLHGFSCPLPGGALPLETRTQGDDNLVQVAHHIRWRESSGPSIRAALACVAPSGQNQPP